MKSEVINSTTDEPNGQCWYSEFYYALACSVALLTHLFVRVHVSSFLPPVLAAAVTQASLRSMLHKLLAAGPAFNITALLSAAQHSNQGMASSLSLAVCSRTTLYNVLFLFFSFLISNVLHPEKKTISKLSRCLMICGNWRFIHNLGETHHTLHNHHKRRSKRLQKFRW